MTAYLIRVTYFPLGVGQAWTSGLTQGMIINVSRPPEEWCYQSLCLIGGSWPLFSVSSGEWCFLNSARLQEAMGPFRGRAAGWQRGGHSCRHHYNTCPGIPHNQTKAALQRPANRSTCKDVVKTAATHLATALSLPSQELSA